MAFQPDAFRVEEGLDRLACLYQRAEVLVCNEAQAVVVTGGHVHDPFERLEPLVKLASRSVVVLNEAGGAVASDGTGRYRVPPFPDSSAPFERTGKSSPPWRS
ncbi:MAG TPA: hypothetical protein VED84_07795 [Acidimicrobiales bacterium]|nr:hypothetical protein [Acidimicrobiales bacterium]